MYFYKESVNNTVSELSGNALYALLLNGDMGPDSRKIRIEICRSYNFN